MSIVEPGWPGARLTARVREILTTPSATWDQIEREPATQVSLYLTYVMPLAAIGPIAGFIGAVVFGNPKDGVSFRPPVLSALGAGIAAYLTTLVGVFLLAGWHGFLAGQRKKIAAGTSKYSGRFWRMTNEIPFLLAIVMVLSVTLEWTF